MLRRLHPRLGVDHDRAAAFLLGDEDAVEADVQDADAVGEAADVEGDAAFVAVLALDFDEEAGLLTRDDAYFGLARGRYQVARLDDFRHAARDLTRHFLAVDFRLC